MRIVFMGTPEFSVPSFKALCDAGYEIAGVFTQPDRPKGRGRKLAPSPVKEEALRRGIPVFQPQRIRKDGVEDFKSLEPDLCVTAAFGQILSQEILDIPKYGCVNVHASILPKHRGSAPIAWGILNGDREAGVTTMMMAAGIDDGDMLLQRRVEIGETETCGELTERLSLVGAELLIETLEKMRAGTLTRIPQDHSMMTYDPRLTHEMGLVDWSRPAKEIARQINALNPWPGCSTPLGDGRLKWLRAVFTEGSGAPGEVLSADPKMGLVVAAGGGAVRMLEVQAPGKKPMSAADYLRGHGIPLGAVLPSEKIEQQEENA